MTVFAKKSEPKGRNKFLI